MMTRTHVARRLLEHGPLPLREFQEITGWKLFRCNNVLQRLREQGHVERVNLGGSKAFYRLAR